MGGGGVVFLGGRVMGGGALVEPGGGLVVGAGVVGAGVGGGGGGTSASKNKRSPVGVLNIIRCCDSLKTRGKVMYFPDAMCCPDQEFPVYFRSLNPVTSEGRVVVIVPSL
jgi:hypothetical protein